MSKHYSTQEHFSISFEGQAIEQHKISASALAQSLLALDGLARRSAQAVYGRDAEIDIQVKGEAKPGAFSVDMAVRHDAPIAAGVTSAAAILGQVISLGKWARGKKVREVVGIEETGASLSKTRSGTPIFNQCAVTVCNNTRTMDQLSRLTQTLDSDGVDSVKFVADNSEPQVITRQDRVYFRQEEGLVLTDNEAESILEIVGPKLNGSPRDWTFSEGEDGIEVVADVEDEDFLAAIRDRKIVLENGTNIRAIVRTIQRKKVRTRTDRTIVEVKELFPPGGVGQKSKQASPRPSHICEGRGLALVWEKRPGFSLHCKKAICRKRECTARERLSLDNCSIVVE